jgi:hypothetical protein
VIHEAALNQPVATLVAGIVAALGSTGVGIAAICFAWLNTKATLTQQRAMATDERTWQDRRAAYQEIAEWLIKHQTIIPQGVNWKKGTLVIRETADPGPELEAKARLHARLPESSAGIASISSPGRRCQAPHRDTAREVPGIAPSPSQWAARPILIRARSTARHARAADLPPHRADPTAGGRKRRLSQARRLRARDPLPHRRSSQRYAQIQAQAERYTHGPRMGHADGVTPATIGGLGMCFGGFAIYRDQRRLNREHGGVMRVTR